MIVASSLKGVKIRNSVVFMWSPHGGIRYLLYWTLDSVSIIVTTLLECFMTWLTCNRVSPFTALTHRSTLINIYYTQINTDTLHTDQHTLLTDQHWYTTHRSTHTTHRSTLIHYTLINTHYTQINIHYTQINIHYTLINIHYSQINSHYTQINTDQHTLHTGQKGSTLVSKLTGCTMASS